MPRDLEGLCPYCEKAASSPARSVYPFCTSLHRSSHTAGHAKHAERRRVEACAMAGETAEVDGLVHRVSHVRTWKSGKWEKKNYVTYRSEWTLACLPAKPREGLYPPRLDLAVTCLECIAHIDDLATFAKGRQAGFDALYLPAENTAWPPHVAKVWKEKYQRGPSPRRNPGRGLR